MVVIKAMVTYPRWEEEGEVINTTFEGDPAFRKKSSKQPIGP